MAGSAAKIKLQSYDELFGNAGEGDIREIPITELHDFKNHPFKVLMNGEMDALVESIRLHGRVLQPVLARARPQGGYELISGHRRKVAAGLVGLETVPAIVRELTDEEATVIMVDSNLSRETLLFSEKAFAFKMKFDAMTKPGSKMDKQTLDQIGEDASESGRNIQRYIRLTHLITPLLDMVDARKIPFIAAVSLSYLKENEQKELYDRLSQGLNISIEQAARLKQYSESGELTAAMIGLILTQDKPKPKNFSMKAEKLERFFPEEYSREEIEAVILELLEQWKEEKDG